MSSRMYTSFHGRGAADDSPIRCGIVARLEGTQSFPEPYLEVSLDGLSMYIDRAAIPAFRKILVALEALPARKTEPAVTVGDPFREGE